MTERAEPPDRLTINLTAKGKKSMEKIMTAQDSNKTDVINRSLSLSAFLIDRSDEWDVVLRHRVTGEIQLLHFL